MNAIVLQFKLNWQQRLLVSFCALNFGAFILLHVWVNSSFSFSKGLVNLSAGYTALLVYGPGMFLDACIKRLAAGASKAQVVAFLGPPRFNESHLRFPGCSASIASAGEVWFYEIAPCELIALCFKGDTCFMVAGLESREQFNFVQWKLTQIKLRAVGQTRGEIEAWLGQCFPYPEDSNVSAVLSGTNYSTDSAVTEFPGRIYVGTSIIQIQMKNGRCVDVQSDPVFF